jgi:hypothetical protein
VVYALLQPRQEPPPACIVRQTLCFHGPRHRILRMARLIEAARQPGEALPPGGRVQPEASADS